MITVAIVTWQTKPRNLTLLTTVLTILKAQKKIVAFSLFALKREIRHLYVVPKFFNNVFRRFRRKKR